MATLKTTKTIKAGAKVEAALKGWKPVFGNPNHIEIAQLYSDVLKMRTTYKHELEVLKKKKLVVIGNRILKENIINAEERILWLLSKDNLTATPT